MITKHLSIISILLIHATFRKEKQLITIMCCGILVLTIPLNSLASKQIFANVLVYLSNHLRTINISGHSIWFITSGYGSMINVRFTYFIEAQTVHVIEYMHIWWASVCIHVWTIWLWLLLFNNIEMVKFIMKWMHLRAISHCMWNKMAWVESAPLDNLIVRDFEVFTWANVGYGVNSG